MNNGTGTSVLAIAAAVCFILAFLGIALAGHSLIALGLFFLALHFVVPVTIPRI